MASSLSVGADFLHWLLIHWDGWFPVSLANIVGNSSAIDVVSLTIPTSIVFEGSKVPMSGFRFTPVTYILL